MAHSADRPVSDSPKRGLLYALPSRTAAGTARAASDANRTELAGAIHGARCAVAEYDMPQRDHAARAVDTGMEPVPEGVAPSFPAGADALVESITAHVMVHVASGKTDDLPAAVSGALRELATILRAADRETVTELQATRDQLERALEAARGDVRALRERLQSEYVEARREIRGAKHHLPLAADSRAVQQALAQVEQVAPTAATVLLLGETGVGKELFAEVIHELSPRRQKKIVRVNCAAIPTALIESELFGRERGAYTGALSRQIGRFELAEGSTIFLDEVGELPLEVQTKLLRVLQNRVIERLGSTTPIPVNVRIIAATNRDLDQAVAEKTFREDLYYRLNVFPVRVPPLRERVEDIPTLVWGFIEEFASACGKRIESLSKASLHALQTYSWPGNVRELRNVVERAVITAKGPDLVVEVPRPTSLTKRRSLRLIDVETDHIRSVLESNAWRVRGRGGAAELLGMKPTTLESRMAKLGIVRPAGERAPAKADGGRRITIE